MFSYLSIGQRIKSIRIKKNMTQEKLSELINKTPTYISYIECGIKCMSLETLIDIANALEVTADVLLSDCFISHNSISSKEFSQILDDCSLYESRVIIDNAKSLKAILRDNKFTLFTNKYK